jgi:uncharacterized membrane protein (DUF2068 family)
VIDFALDVQRHAVSAVALEVSKWLVQAAEYPHVWPVVGALVLDGVATFVEAIALIRGWWWGPWLVVLASSILIPFEVVALLHRLTATRSAILVINLLIVAYLVRRIWRSRSGGLIHAP